MKLMKSCSSLPLVGLWLYRMEAWRTVRRVRCGDVPAVRHLAAIFCTSPDPGARDLAGRGLSDLKSPDQADLLCRETLLRDSDALTALTISRGYAPTGPAARALWFFCNAETARLRQLDAGDHFPLLAAGYAGADEPVRERARNAAHRNTACGILARALTGPEVTQGAAGWSYGEWEVIIRGVTGEERWGDLWLLASRAPLPLSVDAIRSLRTAGWQPPGDERPLWEELVCNLPDRWIFPPDTGEPRDPVGRPAAQVARLCFSEDGSLLATGCCDGMVTVRNTASAGPAAEFQAGTSTIVFLSFTPDNSCLVSAGDDGHVRCHRLEDSTLLWSWKHRKGTVFTVSAGGRMLLAGDVGGCLRMLDSRDGSVMDISPLHPSPITCIVAVPGGPAIACGHADGTVSVIRQDDSTRPLILPGSGSPVLALSFPSRGTECIAVYERGNPSRWDIVTGEKIAACTGHAGRAICCTVPEGAGWFGIGSDDHTFRCWNPATSAPVSVIPFYSRHITSCSAAAGGRYLASGFHDGSVRIYDMPGGALVREFRGHKKTVTSCTPVPGGDRLATVSWDGTTKLWRVPGGEIVRTFDAGAGCIAALAGPAGTLLAAVTENGVARIIDGADGRILRTIDLYSPAVRAAAMNPYGTWLVIAGADSSVRCWNIRNGSLVAAEERQRTSSRCCTFIPGMPAFVAGSWDGTCRICRIPEMAPVRILAGHTSIVTCCAVSKDGLLLATGSNDTTVRLWQTGGDEAYAVLSGSRSEVGAVAFSPDGTLLAAGNREGMIRLWQLPYGTPAPGLPDLPGRVTALLFAGNGCILAAGYETGTIGFFSLPERALVRTVPAHSGPVTGLALLPDNKTLVSTGTDGICRFHAAPCIPFLVHASLDDIPAPVPGVRQGAGIPGGTMAAFHRAILALRFHGEIGICPPLPDATGCYDIQIAG